MSATVQRLCLDAARQQHLIAIHRALTHGLTAVEVLQDCQAFVVAAKQLVIIAMEQNDAG